MCKMKYMNLIFFKIFILVNTVQILLQQMLPKQQPVTQRSCPAWLIWLISDGQLIADSGGLRMFEQQGRGKKKGHQQYAGGHRHCEVTSKGIFFTLYLPYAHPRVCFFFTCLEGQLLGESMNCCHCRWVVAAFKLCVMFYWQNNELINRKITSSVGHLSERVEKDWIRFVLNTLSPHIKILTKFLHHHSEFSYVAQFQCLLIFSWA